MSNKWFSADLHIGHKRILEFCGDTRRGETVEEHDELIVEACNSVIKPEDEFFILGDEALGDRRQGYNKIRRINGRKHLIRGNHTQIKEEHFDIFESISDYKEIRIEGIKVIMFHFPIISWNEMSKGSFMLHGHCHANLKDFGGKMMDVGIDTRPSKDMKPWSWEEIKARMNKREIKQWDHHGA